MFLVKANLVSLSDRTPFRNQQRERNELHKASHLTPRHFSPRTETSLRIHCFLRPGWTLSGPGTLYLSATIWIFLLAVLLDIFFFFFKAIFLRVALASYGIQGTRCKLLILHTRNNRERMYRDNICTECMFFKSVLKKQLCKQSELEVSLVKPSSAARGLEVSSRTRWMVDEGSLRPWIARSFFLTLSDLCNLSA